MARAHLRYTVKDRAGNAIQGARGYVYERNTTTPLTDLWSAESGGTVLPYIDSNGEGVIEGWVDTWRRIDLRVVNDGTAYYSGYPGAFLPAFDFTKPGLDLSPDPTGIATAATIASAVTTHEGAADPHTGYQKESEKDQANGYAGLDGSGLVPIAKLPSTLATDAEVVTAVTTHEAAADPHAGYQRESEKGAASGYAGLDASSHVPTGQLGSGVADGTKLLRGDSTWATIPSGGSAHVIAESGTPLTARTSLNFAAGVIATDDAANDKTDVNLDYAGTATLSDIAATEAAGTSPSVPRGDHVHAHPVLASGDLHSEYVKKSVWDANSVVIANSDDTPVVLAMGASTILARLAAGGIVAATPAQLKTLLAIAESDVTNLTTDLAAKIDKAIGTAKGDLIGFSASGTPVRRAVGANRTRLIADSAQSDGLNWAEAQIVIVWSSAGALTVVTGKSRWYADKAYTIKAVRASVNTAPTGAAVIVDVNKNGTTIFTTQANRPTVAISGFTSGLVTNADVTSLAAGDEIRIDIDQIGSTVAGSDLTVQIVLAEA